jgi:hypothetical protein
MSYSWVFTPFVGDVDSLDHQAEAAANVLSQYPDSVRLLAFLDAFVDQAQSLEELSQDILVMRSVYTAEGVQLDTLGDIVGLERGELSDDAYRIFILGKIYANRADGEIQQINELLADILGYPTVKVRELFPAGLEIYAAGVTYPDVVNRIMALMVAAGVYYGFASTTTTDDKVFKTAPTSNAETGLATNGWSYDTEGGTDGLIAGLKTRRMTQ